MINHSYSTYGPPPFMRTELLVRCNFVVLESKCFKLLGPHITIATVAFTAVYCKKSALISRTFKISKLHKIFCEFQTNMNFLGRVQSSINHNVHFYVRVIWQVKVRRLCHSQHVASTLFSGCLELCALF